MDDFNWECPFCGRHTTISRSRVSSDDHYLRLPTKHGDQLALHSDAIACPNEQCKELWLFASLKQARSNGRGGMESYGDALESWRLRPQAAVQPFPDYVPAPILQDYREACLIRDLSPKASATLSRRCLQGMIRNFWSIVKATLAEEVNELKGRVDPATWDAIDGLRHIGNIGAHMEKDINLVVAVDPDEATLLISLIETLIADWYIARHDRQERMASVKAAVDKKKQLKQEAKAALEQPKATID